MAVSHPGSAAGGPFTPPGPEAKVFVISVAAELSGLHPQTLRSYDRLGIVQAGRTGGGGRGSELEHQADALQQTIAELRADLAAARQALGTVQNLPVRVTDSQITVWHQPRR